MKIQKTENHRHYFSRRILKKDILDVFLINGKNNPSINLFLYNEISEYNFSHWKYKIFKCLNYLIKIYFINYLYLPSLNIILIY